MVSLLQSCHSDSHTALCFSKSLAVVSSAVIIIMILETATVNTSIFSIFTIFKAMLIVFLYTDKLTAISFISSVNRSCLSLYTLSAEIFNFYFVTFAVTFFQLKFCVSIFAVICAQVFDAVLSAF